MNEIIANYSTTKRPEEAKTSGKSRERNICSSIIAGEGIGPWGGQPREVAKRIRSRASDLRYPREDV